MKLHLPHERRHETAPVSGPAVVKGPLSLPEVRIAIIYVLIASLWIIGSDSLVHLWLGDAADTIYIQSFKGLNFVLTTGLLLYFVLRRAFGGWRRSEEQRMAEMAVARQRFRNLSSRIQNLREEERTRISREIHDELGQFLTGIKMQLRLLEDQLGGRDDRSLNPAIDELVETAGMIDDAIESVRRIASGLRPLALDHLGLTVALDEEAEQFSHRSGLECHLAVGVMGTPLPPAVETAAFRIFQESLTNVARHAKARRVDAGCAIREGNLILTIRDDGVGMDPALIEDPASLGLIGMMERATDLGGGLGFNSAPGQGTEVILTIPLAEDTVLQSPAGHEDSRR